MKLENQVVSLELSKRLKDLGFEQKSLWWYEVYDEGGSCEKISILSKAIEGDYHQKYSAYTVAELGEMLPRTFKTENRMYILKIDKFADEFAITYFSDGKAKTVQSDNEANARAEMLIWLKENKYL